MKRESVYLNGDYTVFWRSNWDSRADFPSIADRCLDFTAVLPCARPRANPPHYEIVVNVFRTRWCHLVKFQSSRPIVAVRADSGNYRPIKPPLHPSRNPHPLILPTPILSLRTVRRHPSFPAPTEPLSTSRPPLFPASDVRQISAR